MTIIAHTEYYEIKLRQIVFKGNLFTNHFLSIEQHLLLVSIVLKRETEFCLNNLRINQSPAEFSVVTLRTCFRDHTFISPEKFYARPIYCVVALCNNGEHQFWC